MCSLFPNIWSYGHLMIIYRSDLNKCACLKDCTQNQWVCFGFVQTPSSFNCTVVFMHSHRTLHKIPKPIDLVRDFVYQGICLQRLWFMDFRGLPSQSHTNDSISLKRMLKHEFSHSKFLSHPNSWYRCDFDVYFSYNLWITFYTVLPY